MEQNDGDKPIMNIPKYLPVAVCLLLLAMARAVAGAPESNVARKAPTRVLLLGSYHFANPGHDVMNIQAGDILSEEKQKQVIAVVDALARFKPTKVMIESRHQEREDQDYAAYVAGERELGADETEQLGYRLARRVGLDRVYAVDEAGEFDFGVVMEYARQHDPSFLDFVDGFRKHFQERYRDLPLEQSVREALHVMNEPAAMHDLNAFYPLMATVGAGDNWVGADVVADWHKRNIRIFGNIARHTKPGDRVLVIFGSGHMPTLRYMVDYAPDMELVDPLKYL